MNIIGTQYTLETNSFEIYVSGCRGNPHCTGCHNPESWDFNLGHEYNMKYYLSIKSKIIMFNSLINNIMIFGGEPLDNDHDELLQLLFDLRGLNKKIWLFTRYEFDELPKFILDLCDYVKCGRYLEDLKTDNNIMFGIKLASSNQKIYKLN
jgi:anaerobic ribonucleoside-triphosphate reductase activating protein